MTPLKASTIVLGVCGSIAAYKAADLTSKLVQAGANVDVIMTTPRSEFITPFTFRSLTGRPVLTDMFEPADRRRRGARRPRPPRRPRPHRPCSANTMASSPTVWRTTCCRLPCSRRRRQSSSRRRWTRRCGKQPRRRRTSRRCRRAASASWGPTSGRLASGYVGAGRLAEPETIVGAAKLAARPSMATWQAAHRRQRRRHARADRPGAVHQQPLERQDGLRAG